MKQNQGSLDQQLIAFMIASLILHAIIMRNIGKSNLIQMASYF